METKHKVVIITGASGGIGEATAALLGSEKVKLVLSARKVERVTEIAQNIAEHGGIAISAGADVTRRKEVDALVQLALDHFGKIDVLVNCAGIGPISPLDELRVGEWNAMVDVNIRGLLHIIAATLPTFRRQGFGHFINIVSTADRKTVPTQTVYSATKVAARTICDGLRQEAGDKLRVTLVSPGFVKTNFIDGIANREVRNQYATLRDKIAITPDAIARAVLFAMEQPPDVDVNEIVIRPTAQS